MMSDSTTLVSDGTTSNDDFDSCKYLILTQQLLV